MASNISSSSKRSIPNLINSPHRSGPIAQRNLCRVQTQGSSANCDLTYKGEVSKCVTFEGVGSVGEHLQRTGCRLYNAERENHDLSVENRRVRSEQNPTERGVLDENQDMQNLDPVSVEQQNQLRPESLASESTTNNENIHNFNLTLASVLLKYCLVKDLNGHVILKLEDLICILASITNTGVNRWKIMFLEYVKIGCLKTTKIPIKEITAIKLDNRDFIVSHNSIYNFISVSVGISLKHISI